MIMKVCKISKNYDFRVVYGRGKSISNRLLVLYTYKNRKFPNINRLGISVSKKVGNSVTRNRVRRIIYEIYRLNLIQLKCGYDIIFIVKSDAKDKLYKEMEESVISLLKKGSMFYEKE